MAIEPITEAFVIKVASVVVLTAILPLTTLAYFWYRKGLREKKIDRILTVLNIDLYQDNIYTHARFAHYFLALLFPTLISLLGLTALILGAELELAKEENMVLGGPLFLQSERGDVATYQEGALMVFGMAFLGAYLWGLRDLFRRYSTYDLLPGTSG